MNNQIISFFAKFIENELGITYSESNYYQLQNRLEEITRILSLKDINELYELSKNKISLNLKQLLLDTATNNETLFFRDPKVFKSINSYILPKLFQKNSSSEKIRIWSAASSFGQEPYSLAILIKEFCISNKINCDVEIIASDVSTKALERAQTGKYSQLEVQRGLSVNLLVKYFKKDNDNYWTIDPEIRKMITFKKINLLDSLEELKKFELVLCRNVLIYQNVNNKIRIIKKIENCLKSPGYIIFGAGESLMGLSDSFDTVKNEEAIFYSLKSKK